MLNLTWKLIRKLWQVATGNIMKRLALQSLAGPSTSLARIWLKLLLHAACVHKLLAILCYLDRIAAQGHVDVAQPEYIDTI